MSTKKTQAAKTKKRRQARAVPAPETSARDTSAPTPLSALSAAARVLAETGKAMNCRQLIETMAARGYWTSPGGRTPEATLASYPCRRHGPRDPRQGSSSPLPQGRPRPVRRQRPGVTRPAPLRPLAAGVPHRGP